MRFEIGAGGTFLILVGLLGLSGAVFALGLIAGYEMARQNQPDVSLLSSVYSVPSPPALEATPEASAAEALAPGVGDETSPGGVAAAPKPSTAPRAAMTPAAVARARPPIAPAVRPPAAASTEESDDEEEEEAPPPRAVASVPSPAAPVSGVIKPYNIQIEAVMDKSGADDMVAKLKALGYQPHESQTPMNGEIWYRVQIGPYATQDEAKAAQEKLKQQYRAAYSTH
jgi:DedD protein